MLLIDLDNFKQINDRHGHPAGDAMLRAVGRVIRESLPPTGLAGRLGGDELALLVMETSQTLPACCQTLQQRVADATRPLAGGPISLSIGLTSLQQGESFEQAYPRADRALYAAKQAGRQRLHPGAAPQRAQAAVAPGHPDLMRPHRMPGRSADRRPAYRRYVAECGAAGLPLYQVAQFDPDQWLQELLAHADGLHLPPGYPPTTTYFALEGRRSALLCACVAATTPPPASGLATSVTRLAPPPG